MPHLIQKLPHPIVFDNFIYIPGTRLDLQIPEVQVELDGQMFEISAELHSVY